VRNSPTFQKHILSLVVDTTTPKLIAELAPPNRLLM
jgi:hypothetical protein